jgi:capsular polysaccharide biosynthesis protein
LYRNHRDQPNGERQKLLLDSSERELEMYRGSYQDEYVLSNRDLILLIRRHSLMIAVCSLVFAVAAVAYSLSQTPVYEARSSLLVGQASGIGQSPTEAVSLQSVAPTVAEAAMTYRIAGTVVEELNLKASPDELLENITAQQVSESQFVEILYTDSDPEQAQQIAETFAEELSQQISALETDAAASTEVPPLSATVWDRAVVAPEPVSPNPLRNGLVALAVGMVVGSGLALLMEMLRNQGRGGKK